MLTHEQLYIAESRVGDSSNFKVCIHKPVPAELNRYTRCTVYKEAVNMQINVAVFVFLDYIFLPDIHPYVTYVIA